MSTIALLLALLSAAAPLAAGQGAATKCVGPLPLSVDGAAETWSVITNAGASGISTSNASVTMAHNDRAYIVSQCLMAFSPDLYAKNWRLLGRALNFTVDISSSGCACNVAFYMVSMPGFGSDQQPFPAQDGSYYCDANDVDGNWCPEVDIMEANTAALAVTPHTCAAPEGKHFTACDRGGCSVNSHKASASGFGPGPAYTINSLLPFVVSTAFPVDASGALAAMTTTLSQAGASFVLRHTTQACGAGYLANMTAPLAKGMVPAISVWGDAGSTMNWLDVPPCDVAKACDASAAAGIFSDFSITKL